MSQSDDIDKLLREIEAMNKRGLGASGAAPVPAERSACVVASGRGSAVQGGTGEGSRGGRIAWTGVSAVGGFLAGGLVGTVLAILPSIGTLSTAVGAALGGALVGFVSGPPGWFDRE
jgi:hypothetical protein